MRTTVVVGNPRPASRTLDAGTVVARTLSGRDDFRVIDLAALGQGLLSSDDVRVNGALAAVADSHLAIIASPTYKGTYTGLLKLFLDKFDTGAGLRNVVAVPLQLGARPNHAMAPDLLLKPVLVELGAITPAPGLYLSQTTYATDGSIGEYVQRWGDVLLAAVHSAEAS